MKFPLERRPFAPLQLTRGEREGFARTALAVVHEAVDAFDDFVHRQNRTLDPTQWKAVKTRELVTVYKKRELEDMTVPRLEPATPSGASSSASSASSGESGGSSNASVSAITKWPLPKLLGVGSIVGDFDDVMYGVISPDLPSINVKTTYVDDELVDSDILAVVRAGCDEDPYRFVGIKWFVKSTPSANLVRPRDFTFIEATGVYVAPHSGERIGYHVMHSVELAACPSLERPHGILRGKLSSCFLFRALPERRVEVFMQSFVEPAGRVPDVVAIQSATNGLVGFWKSVYAAERKKLAWLVRRDARNTATSSAKLGIRLHKDAEGNECCAVCAKAFSTFRVARGCQLCRAAVCSRCETSRRLTFVAPRGRSVRRVDMVFCKHCIMSATAMDAREFARREHVHSGGNAAATATATATATARSRARETRAAPSEALAKHHRHQQAAWMGEVEADPLRVRLDSLTDVREPSIAAPSWAGSVPQHHDQQQLVVVAPTSASSSTNSRPASKSTAAAAASLSHEQLLMERMRALRLQAEQAYRLTAQNNHAMVDLSAAASERRRGESAALLGNHHHASFSAVLDVD